MSFNEYDPYVNDSRPPTAFIDLQAKTKLENFLYGGKKAITYFIRETVKTTWFTQVPIKMQLNTTNITFNKKFNAKISRSGDYLLNAWLRVTLDPVSVYDSGIDNFWPNFSPYTNISGNETITWTPNFMHNLLEECSFNVNGLILDELYSEHLDFYAAFMIPKRSRVGYNRMIGNFTSPNNGMAGINVNSRKAITFGRVNTTQELFLPLPFFFSKSPGMALPVSSLPYSDIKINFKFRNWDKLLCSIKEDGRCQAVIVEQLKNKIPTLSNVQVWGNYAIVTNKERENMACTSRDMLIEQSQQLGGSYGSGKLNATSWNSTTDIDLRFSGSVKTLFFAARNQMQNVNLPFRSVYSTGVPKADSKRAIKVNVSGNINGIDATALGNNSVSAPTNVTLNWFAHESDDYSALSWDADGTNPIGTAQILYENATRINMESSYYSLIQPYYHGRNVPDSGCQHGTVSPKDSTEVSGNAALSIGYNMYSYALKPYSIDPTGSSNFSKLRNVTMVLTPSRSAINLSANKKGPWFIFVSAISTNILRIQNGAVGFPIA